MPPLVVHGLKVPIQANEVSAVVWAALAAGTYEAKEAYWAVNAVRPGDRILELGAGIGVITSLLAGIEGVHVWAFEANPATVRLAERVVAANDRRNVTIEQGLLTAGPPRDLRFYVRRDLWMSSLVEHQGDYEKVLTLSSLDIDEFIARRSIDLVVMDIEGAERDLLANAELRGVERVFLELHDHLYGLGGVRELTLALAEKGFAYDPRGSRGACVLFSRNDDKREYEEETSVF